MLHTLDTKKIIETTFIQLVRKNGFNAVSVTAIAKKAGINRGTFYLHFSDKYDLLDSIEQQFIDKLAHIVNSNTGQLNKSLLMKIIELVKQERSLMYTLSKDQTNLTFQAKLKQFLDQFFTKEVKLHPELEKYMSDVPRIYLRDMAIKATGSVIGQWVSNDLSETPEEIVNIVSKIVDIRD